jgi:putative hemolysin
MEAFIILGLILLNGFFALSEMALVSSKKSRLEGDARHGNKKAQKAYRLIGNPDTFFSTIQIGITLIGILTGLFSGKSMIQWLSAQIARMIPPLANTSNSISFFVIVFLVTYLSLIFGELLPKRIAMSNPEKYAKMVSGFMIFLSKIGIPFVWLISVSTNSLMKLFGISHTSMSKVTEDEIKDILQEGTNEGQIQEVEHDIVERAFNLRDRDVDTLMTHRNDLVWLDLEDSIDENRNLIISKVHNTYPVSSGELDEIVGVVFLKDIFSDFNNPDFNLRKYIKPAQFVPETMNGYNVLELFRKSQLFYAIITDEYGNVEGIVTMNDLLEALIGNIIEPDEHEEQIVKREDDSWLVDGQYSFYDFLAYFDMEDLYQEHDYNTLSGLILDILEHIPNTSEKLRWKDFEMEIVDMDAARIDKVLVKKIEETELPSK